MKRSYKQHTREEYEKIIPTCMSFTEACHKMGRKPVGGTITNIKLMCKRWNIDTSHMTGAGHRKGKRALNRRSADEVLVMGTSKDHRQKGSKLRRCLIEIGTAYQCNSCGINEWLGVELTLEVDHIDECYWNNTRENLQFLCPNCHSLKTLNAPLAQ